MKRIKLINRIFYCIFLLGFLLFMASGFIFSTVDKVTPADKRTSVVVKPEDTRYIGDDTIEYHVKIRASAGNNNALAFVSRHQEVEVYAGGRLIYYIKAHRSVYGTTTGTNYTIVNIPPYTTDIIVRLTNVYAGHKIRGTTFEYGDKIFTVSSTQFVYNNSWICYDYIMDFLQKEDCTDTSTVLFWYICNDYRCMGS